MNINRAGRSALMLIFFFPIFTKKFPTFGIFGILFISGAPNPLGLVSNLFLMRKYTISGKPTSYINASSKPKSGTATKAISIGANTNPKTGRTIPIIYIVFRGSFNDEAYFVIASKVPPNILSEASSNNPSLASSVSCEVELSMRKSASVNAGLDFAHLF